MKIEKIEIISGHKYNSSMIFDRKNETVHYK